MKQIAVQSLLLVLVSLSTTIAQIRVTSVEKLSLDTAKEWSNPEFSPYGQKIYFTIASYDGIWEYSLTSKITIQITADAKSGFGFAVSPDGKRIAYRRVRYKGTPFDRIQEVVEKNLVDGTVEVLDSGPEVSTPVYAKKQVFYSVGEETMNLPTEVGESEIEILGIQNTKIALLREGIKTLFDPFGNGSYIWPSLSPDKKWIVAYEMNRGTFVCDLEGRITATLGRCDAPVWTRDGRWIVFMDDKDDGHNIISSELTCISPDGRIRLNLTNTENVIELNPRCSPTEDTIVYNSLKGEIYLLTYEEEKR